MLFRSITGYHGFCQGSDCLVLPTWNHLWFVAYLWVYTAVLYVGVLILPGVATRLRRFAECRLAGVGILLAPIAYLALIHIALSQRFPSTHALFGDWYNHATYGAVFLLGFMLAGTRAPWADIARARWIALGAALLGWGGVCALMGIYASVAEVPPTMLIIGQIGRAHV